MNELNLEAVQSSVHKALRAWHVTGGTPDDLMANLLLVKERQAIVAGDGSPATLRLATNQILLEALEELDAQDPTGVDVLRRRFIENETLASVSYRINVSEHSVSRLQRAAIERLGEIIYGREMALRRHRAQRIEARLPPPTYTHLFGVDDARAQLAAQLSGDAPWVTAIVGIGGLGKTALADAVTRQLIQELRFEHVIWLRINPQTMSGLSHSPKSTLNTLINDITQWLWPEASRSPLPNEQLTMVRVALKQHPYLVVIDNLERETDTAFLLAHLNDLAKPSKFLLTSRARLAEQTAVYNFSLEELSLADAAALLRHHAQESGIAAVAEATDADIQAIYTLTGGNPLALKLVVSLLDTLSLPQITAGFQAGRPGPIEDLYRHIYWQTWRILSLNARSLLQAMPLVGETGANPEYLCVISGLTEEQLWPAVHELRHRSLLEVWGNLQEKRYGIHRLTEAFLRTEIIHWPEDDDL